MKTMIKYVLTVATSFFIGYPMSSQTYDPEMKYPTDQLQEDFTTLRRLIEENHPALYRYYDVEFWSDYCDSLYSLVNHPMTEPEFIKILEPMVAKVHCGHTELWYSEDFQDFVYSQKLFIPLSAYYIHDTAYIKRQYTDKNILPEGSRILSINNIDVRSIQESLFETMNGDGFNKQNILFTINKTPVSILSKYFDYSEKYEIEIIRPSESVPTLVSVKGIKYDDLLAIAGNRYGDNPDRENFSFRIADSLSTAIISIHSFVKNEDDNYVEFLKSSFGLIDEQNIQNLIVDVRGNDGGHPDYSVGLLKYLINHDFIYFKTKLDDPEMNNPITPYSNSFKGNLYVLMNGGELSTTGHFISLLKYHKTGKLVGQESGSTFSCNDNSLVFSLPNTHIRGKVARTTFETAVSGLSQEKGIMPDYHVEPDIRDIIKNIDTIMDYTLKLIRDRSR
ncbi:MAG: S41 family peptidase [Bacteroidales bacterium]|nr:S41 family peptidase [Bacteroidales bacterium]